MLGWFFGAVIALIIFSVFVLLILVILANTIAIYDWDHDDDDLRSHK